MTTKSPDSALEVILPVRDMAGHIGHCLEPLVAQIGPLDRITVIDDGSTDDTAAIAKQYGAHVVRLPESRGPYHARHLIASRSEAAYLIFIDGRSRPGPSLVKAHRAMLCQPRVALSCTNVSIVETATLASRIAKLQDIFCLDRYIGVPGRPDYFPTSNLGVLTAAYREVGGFRAMRSGADADLCWRIQAAGLGLLACDRDVHMQWVPRETFGELAKQWYRYGQSSFDLNMLKDIEGLEALIEPSLWRTVIRRASRLANNLRADPVAALGNLALHAVFRVGALGRSFDRDSDPHESPLYGATS